MHVAKLLLGRGDEVVGIDNLIEYCDPNLRFAPLQLLASLSNFKFVQGKTAVQATIEDLFVAEEPNHVVNLAAQAGVRYFPMNLHSRIQPNRFGFGKILERLHGSAPFRFHNIWSHEPVKLMTFMRAIEDLLSRESKRNVTHAER